MIKEDTDFTKGFVQGLITATITRPNCDTTIPKRYEIALKKLSTNKSIRITPADKNGGIVILDTNTYNDKMHTLLSDENTYIKTNITTINKETKAFIKAYKELFTDEDDKSWIKYIEYHPKIPTLYGLPKIHKENTPMRPITSGIGSTAHKIAKETTKILTPFLGTISPAHIKNSGELLEKLKNINMTNKSLTSLDVESLYTNVPVDKSISALREHLLNINANLPLPIDTIISICTLCTNLTFFQFNEYLYKQKAGLPMGNPLSGVLACLYLEHLETNHFSSIIPAGSDYFRYIDDALLIHPKDLDLPHTVHRLNEIEPSINFTFETESNNSLPFLDIRLHNTTPNLLFSVYRKPTHKNDLIHFYSHHHNRIKSGIIIGSFLRALRISSPEFLPEELSHITQIFSSLQYPPHFIQHAKRKAYKIISQKIKKANNPTSTPAPIPGKFIILPTNPITSALITNSNYNGLKIVTTTSQTIKHIVRPRAQITQTSDACVYRIPCSNKYCKRAYIGETSRSLKMRLYEHEQALKNDDTRNALTQHRNEADHNPSFSKAHILKHIHNTRQRQILESSAIATERCIRQRPGNFHLAKNIAHLIFKEHKIIIPTDNG